jgi:uncharacterized protein with NRDE domain
MCLIVFAWRPGHSHPLLLAANRDEFYARPSLPLAEWTDAPGVFAGRDLEAGGTWLGIGPQRRFAALTNIRAPGQPAGLRSRGELPAAFLRGELTPQAYLQDLGERLEAYAGFNLLVGDDRQLWHLNSRSGQATALSGGLYGLSNAGLDTPWPKVQRAKRALQQCLDDPQPGRLIELLSDNSLPMDSALPDTGVGLAIERLLASVFINSQSYGTRASSALTVNADGSWQLIERSYGPYGAHLGEVSIER